MVTYYMRTTDDANSTDAYLPKTVPEQAGCPDPDRPFAAIMTLEKWQPYPTGGSSAGTSTVVAIDTEPTYEVPNLPPVGPPDTTAPILTLPTGSNTGATTAVGTVTTDEGNGIVYAAVLPAATTPTGPLIRAGQAQGVSSPGLKAFIATGLATSTSYRWHYIHDDAALNPSNISSSASFSTAAPADTTAPVLTLPVFSAVGATTVTAGATTDEGNGTMWGTVLPAATVPTEPMVTAGLSQVVSSTGAKSFNFTGLTPSTSYRAHLHQKDAALNPSLIASTASFTTAATAGISNQTIVFGGKTLASAGGVKAIDNEGNEVDFTSINSIVSGTGTGYTVSGGRLVRSSVPADSHGAVLRCGTTLGIIDVTIQASGTISLTATRSLDLGFATPTTIATTMSVNLANTYSVLADATQLTAALAACTGGEFVLLRRGTLGGAVYTLSGYGSGTSGAPTYATTVTIASHETAESRWAWIKAFSGVGTSKIRLQHLKLASPLDTNPVTNKDNPQIQFTTSSTYAVSVNNEVIACNFIGDPVNVLNQPYQLRFGSHDELVRQTGAKIKYCKFDAAWKSVSFAGISFTTIANEVTHASGDMFFCGYYGGEWVVAFNNTHLYLDDGDDATHFDHFQMGVTHQHFDYDGTLWFIANSADLQTAIEAGQGCPYCDDLSNDEPHYFHNVHIGLNTCRCIHPNTMHANSVMRGVWAGNTVIFPLLNWDFASSIPHIQCEYFTRSGVPDVASEDVLIEYNVTHDASVGTLNTRCIDDDNIILPIKDSAQYAAHFAHPLDNQVRYALAPLSGGPLDLTAVKTGSTTRYYDVATETVDFPPHNKVTYSTPGNITGAALNADVAFPWFQVDVDKLLVGGALNSGVASVEGTRIRLAGAMGNPRWQMANDNIGTGATAESAVAGVIPDGKWVRLILHSSPGSEIPRSFVMWLGTTSNTLTVTTAHSDTVPPNAVLSHFSTTTTVTSTAEYELEISLGTPDLDRVIVVVLEASASSVFGSSSVTLNGIAMTQRLQDMATGATAWTLATAGTALEFAETATLIIDPTANIARLQGQIYAVYPDSPTPLFAQYGTLAASTTAATVTGVVTADDGYAIVYASEAAVAGTFTITWSGVDAVVQDSDTPAGVTGAEFSHIICTEAVASGIVTATATISGNKRAAAITFGPQRVVASAPAFQVIGNYFDVNNLTTYTVASVGGGTVHAQRHLHFVLHTTQVVTSVTWGGVAATVVAGDATGAPIWTLKTGGTAAAALTTASLVVTCVAASLRLDVEVYAGYPVSSTPTYPATAAAGTVTQTGTTDAVLSSIPVTAGGYVIGTIAQSGALGSFSLTWTGVDNASLVKDQEAQRETTATIAMFHMPITETHASRQMTGAETVTGPKRLTLAAYGPSA